jgi:DNA modification methylase
MQIAIEKVKPDYDEFIRSKVRLAERLGFDVDDSEINPILKPHQRACVKWAIAGGRRALFESFGLGKSVQQIEIVRIILSRLGRGRGIIVAPLGVRQEFKRDAAMLGVEITFIRKTEELYCGYCMGTGEICLGTTYDKCPDCEGCGLKNGIFLTNYESLRDRKLDPSLFDIISLDEASVLRSFGSKTFGEFVFGKVQSVKYRFVATATPSPNEFQELLAYSHFLGVMDIGQARTRFFKRNSEKSDDLTLHKHKEREFWLWVSSWALFLQKPSDLGYSDEGYSMPEMRVIYHEVKVDHLTAIPDKFGQGQMFRNATAGVVEAAREKRDTLDTRIEKMVEVIKAAPEDSFLLWHDLEVERHAIDDALPSSGYENWFETKDGNPDALALYERHYSARQYADGRERKLFCGPGEKTVLLTYERDALFVWRRFIDDSGQKGINCAVFRNEGLYLSSDLIREAMAIAWQRWPGARLYTYVNAEEIESNNPGYCFLCAGWNKCGKTKGGLVILEVLPGAVIPEVSKRAITKSVYGSQNLDDREQAIIDFSDGKFQYLSAKPSVAGSGCNFQRHCHKAIFLGIGYKFNDFLQAIHRIFRYLQDQVVEIHIIYAESEKIILQTLLEKWERDKEQRAIMTEIIREYGLVPDAARSELTRGFGVERQEISGKLGSYRCIYNDSVEECRSMPENSVDLVVTSVPFSTQYEYSPNYNDFGHTDDNDHFFAQMDYLTPELFRVLSPGRMIAVHCKDRIVPSGMTNLGFQIVYPFHATCIEHYTKHGFGYMGMKTIVTDVVRENNQTYRLGWSEQCKDGTKMGVGMPEYLLYFRKPPTNNNNSYADLPVIKSKETYTRGRWQIDAHGFERVSGDRLLNPDEIKDLPWNVIYKLFRRHSLNEVYDFEKHVALAEALDNHGRLPVDFMLLPPQSWHPDVWTDITRMRSLNSSQTQRGKQVHLCPLPFDIVDRAINQLSMPGETVLDPFAGIMTVPYRAVKLGRKGIGIELNHNYFLDGSAYCEAAEQQASAPTLFELAEMEEESLEVAA